MALPQGGTVAPPKYLAPVVTAIGVLLVLLAGTKVLTLDSNMIVLFAICVFVWVLPSISKFKFGDLEIETRLAKLEEEQEKTVEALTEPENLSSVRPLREKPGVLLEGASPTALLMAALEDGPYAFRSLSAVMRRTGLAADTAEKELQALARAGLVVEVTGKGGKRLWGLTARGRATLTSS